MRRWLAILAVVHATGCERLLKLEHIGTETGDGGDVDGAMSDAFVPNDCSSVDFVAVNPVGLPELTSEVAGDPWLSEDQLELFYAKQVTPYEIWRATRSTTTGTFELSTARETFNVEGVDNVDPSLTLDGKLLVFIVNTGSGRRMYFTERDSEGGWTTPELVPGTSALAVLSAQISWDGLALYFTELDDRLYMAKRASRSEAFEAAIEISPVSTRFATVSSTSLELYDNYDSGGIGRARRSSLGTKFGAQDQLFLFGRDPQLSADSQTLVIAYDNSIVVLQRTCP